MPTFIWRCAQAYWRNGTLFVQLTDPQFGYPTLHQPIFPGQYWDLHQEGYE
ncbi:MAG: hypothetical protein SFV24_19205 [Gemmatimonadales bacterium]|nr:hypothetical protein [Gemmatimonadales bacterium]